MILRREVMAPFILIGGDIISCSTPSMRYRTRSFFSNGSTWMSLAPLFTASAMSEFTSLTTGASSLCASARPASSSISSTISKSSCMSFMTSASESADS